MARCCPECETNQGYIYTYFSRYHRTISSTDPQAHLNKDTNPNPSPVQFFNNDEKTAVCVMFLGGEKEGGGAC